MLQIRENVHETQQSTKHSKKRKVQVSEEYETKSQKIIDALRQEQIFNCFYEPKNSTQKTLFLQKCVKKEVSKETLAQYLV